MGDLNDVVDAAAKAGGCPEVLSSTFIAPNHQFRPVVFSFCTSLIRSLVLTSSAEIFGPGASRNPRLRGNRIGKTVIDYVTELMDKTGGAAPPSAPVDYSLNGPSAPGPAAAAAPAAVVPSTGAASSGSMLIGKSLTRYVFSPDLPFDAQLRIRAEASGDGEILGCVNPDDVIWGNATVTSGTYLRVKVDGRDAEAWMQTSGGGQQFLITESERAQMPQFQGGAPTEAPAPPVNMPEVGGPRMSVATSLNASGMSRPATAPIGDMNASGIMGMSSPNRPATTGSSQMFMGGQMPINMSMGASMMAPPDASMAGHPVPYEVYRRLEMRVNQLEAEFNNLKMALRSV
jgi:hypothetical protein